MLALFDIFRALPDGSFNWVETAGTLEQATKRIEQLMPAQSCDYVILDQRSGNKILVKGGAPNKIRARSKAA